ncbi:dihydrofolate reductase family protein [Terribacillus sp. 179-K 1B1 HS]|uniref:dihydrofolate reductase family protein n=1 Tax=Terribacillus sp. 179-K 1B1 HS TaxID=3142388 RepID=UPI0039A31E6C
MSERKLVLFIATSLDGYIATKEDSLDWLYSVEGEGDNGYSEFYETVDTVLMGKRTYDWIMDHAEQFPYQNKMCYVFTRSEMKNAEDVQFVRNDIVSFINKLKLQEGKDIWMAGGGELLSAFMQEQLVDELILTVAPVLLGSGIPLFKEGNQTKLTLKRKRSFNQFVELHYEVRV